MGDEQNTDTVKKEINISGKHNRYEMKKLVKSKSSPVRRKQVENWDVSPEWFTVSKQIELLNTNETIVKEEITRKIASYRQQDILKKRLNNERLINYNYVKNLLLKCQLKCHYCSEDSLILYETRRDMCQWTVDRIDNSIGHDIDNIVISCLKCNLQRKTRSADKFAQTKQLVIKRDNYEENLKENDEECNDNNTNIKKIR